MPVHWQRNAIGHCNFDSLLWADCLPLSDNVHLNWNLLIVHAKLVKNLRSRYKVKLSVNFKESIVQKMNMFLNVVISIHIYLTRDVENIKQLICIISTFTERSKNRLSRLKLSSSRIWLCPRVDPPICLLSQRQTHFSVNLFKLFPLALSICFILIFNDFICVMCFRL